MLGAFLFSDVLNYLRSMKNLLLFIFSFSGFLQAQSTFEKTILEEDWQKVNQYYLFEGSWSESIDYDFIGASGYLFEIEPIQIDFRVKVNGEWQAWQSMNGHHDANSVEDRQIFVAPTLNEKISAWQIRSHQAILSGFRFRIFIASKENKTQLNQSTEVSSSDSCNCPQPTFCQRSCWCPNNDCPAPSSYTPTNPTHLIVHHSAGSNSSTNYAAVVAYIWDLHKNTNGWSDIGYNWLIDPNGVVYEGRGSGVSGAHFSCLNTGTLGICILGDYRNHPVAPASLQSLADLLLYESCSNGISPADSSLHASSQLVLRHISGHRDANSAQVGCPSGTVCPGAVLYSKLDSLASAMNKNACLLNLNTYFVTEGNHFYPNPVRNILYGDLPEAAVNLSLIDLQGQEYTLERIGNQEWDLSPLSAGTYIIQYYIDQTVIRQKIIIQ